MKCEDFKNHIADLCDRQTDENIKAACMQHLEECAACRAYYEEFMHTVDLLTPHHEPAASRPAKAAIVQAPQRKGAVRKLGRRLLQAAAVVAIFLAWDPNSTVFNIVSFAWAGFGASFGPLVLFSLFWKRTNKYGAIAGMIAGGAMVFIWKYLIAPMGGAWGIYELLPAFLVGCVVIVAVSLATAPPDKEIVETFESV